MKSRLIPALVAVVIACSLGNPHVVGNTALAIKPTVTQKSVTGGKICIGSSRYNIFRCSTCRWIGHSLIGSPKRGAKCCI